MIDQQKQLLLPRTPPEARLDVSTPPISLSHCERAVNLMNTNPSQRNQKSDDDDDDDDDDECSQIGCGCFCSLFCAIMPILRC